MLIELGRRGDASLRDSIQRDLTDVASHPESRSGQLRGRFCHKGIIPDNT
jgi:hypothetical protein